VQVFRSGALRVASGHVTQGPGCMPYFRVFGSNNREGTFLGAREGLSRKLWFGGVQGDGLGGAVQVIKQTVRKRTSQLLSLKKGSKCSKALVLEKGSH